jgi:hypothetical protein
MSVHTLTATLQLDGKTATGIVVPDAIGLGVTIRDRTWPSTFGVRAGQVKLPVSAENRKLAGIEAGDVVEVRLSPRA